MDGLTLRLQIAIDKPHQMQILQCSCHLGRIEARRILVHALIRPRLQRAEELAAGAVFHAQVQVVVGLETVVQRDNKRMVRRGQNLLLGERALDLVALDHFLFGEYCTSTHTHIVSLVSPLVSAKCN